MKKRTLIATTAGVIALAACDSQAENEVERQATAVDESYEAEAEIEESLTQNTPEEEAGEARAKALREEGEEIKDRLEDEADEMDPDPQ